MKFNGEIKFPDLDHPGVPVQALIEDSQLELVVEGESLGRWSLYDVKASRLVASAFLLNLEGEEITFVAADPIDFAYRGVEHMAETWAQIKSKRLPTRSMAVRMSRKGIIPSRLSELQDAMEANLEAQTRPRGIAGEAAAAPSQVEPEETAVPSADWDDRSEAGGIPVVGAVEPEPEPVEPPVSAREFDDELAAERRLLSEERASIEAERRAADEREAVRLEAYKLEMERLEKERDEVRRQSEIAAAKAAELAAIAETARVKPEPVIAEPEPEAEPVIAEPEPEPEPVAAEPEPEAEPVIAEPEPEPDPVAEEDDRDSEPSDDLEPVGAEVVDLNDYESRELEAGDPDDVVVPEPALASSGKDKARLRGAVRSAFARGGGKTHEHRFLEAPGGLGITRYVCEDCGYVSISA